jgi:outer membrane protein assembly factor BamD
MIFRPVCLLFLAAAIAFPASAKSKKLFDCSGQLAKAVEKYDKKKYYDVTTILTDVLVQCPGHNAYDSMLYYQAKSLLALKKYSEAKTEFDRIVQTYPSSPFYEEASYLVGCAMFLSSPAVALDQASTKEAQARLRDFVEAFPRSPLADSAREYIEKADAKFAEKEFESARFYEQIEQYEAAIVYYKMVVNEYPQSGLVPQALLGTAQNLVKLNRAAEAQAVLEDLEHETKDEAILKKAQFLKSRLPPK